MNRTYEDIINHPHHVSKNHPQMSMRNRAAQFSPFAALVGYEDEIDETARQTEERRELDEQETVELNRRLALLQSKLAERPEVSIKYFLPDEFKTGGSYLTVCGVVMKISSVERILTMQNGHKIKIDDIMEIGGEMF